jgi:amine acid ABC transporter, permease protein, 3-TM region, His/Glu/Gln/Arg/opine family
LFGVILGVMGISDGKIFSSISSVIIYIFRGMPMIVLAFFIYIGMPSVIGHKIPLFTAGILTLMLDEGAYSGRSLRVVSKPLTAGSGKPLVHWGYRTTRP